MEEIWKYQWDDEQPKEEIWKGCLGFPQYEVSSHGNVKSNSRKMRGKTLKPYLTGGYLTVLLFNGECSKSKTVHSLMADAFLGICPLSGFVTDHKNNIKTDNRIVNLQRISKRNNNTKDRAREAMYPGITRCKRGKRWVAQIKINGRNKYLGSGDTQEEAHAFYIKRKQELGL